MLEVSGYPHAPAALRLKAIPVLTKQEAGWNTKPVLRFWKIEKCLAATGIRDPDRPFRSLIATLTPKAFYTIKKVTKKQRGLKALTADTNNTRSNS